MPTMGQVLWVYSHGQEREHSGQPGKSIYKKEYKYDTSSNRRGREHRRTDLGKTSQGRKYWSGMKDKYSLAVQKVELKGLICRAKNE